MEQISQMTSEQPSASNLTVKLLVHKLLQLRRRDLGHLVAAAAGPADPSATWQPVVMRRRIA